MLNKSSAFTLIEVMVVISIVGVLSAIALPAFNERRNKSNDISAQADAKNSIHTFISAKK
ncbi:MAG: Tfp structural protein [Pseudomonas sp.]|nr:Tfp structural protein [Pseudomonas sp.]